MSREYKIYIKFVLAVRPYLTTSFKLYKNDYLIILFTLICLPLFYITASTETGDLYTCGDREYGKLGHGLWSLNRADTTEKIVQVACGANHTIALNGK